MRVTQDLLSFAEEFCKEFRELEQCAQPPRVTYERLMATGRLLLQKLGPFAVIWKGVFDPPHQSAQMVTFVPTSLPAGVNPLVIGVAKESAQRLLGNAESILDAIKKGRLMTVEEAATVEVLGDLLEHANVLLQNKHNLASAVVLRAVLEERLRKLCEKHSCQITSTKPTIETFKQALYKADVIDKIGQAKIDYMAKIGNAAAHASEEFRTEDVPALYKDTMDFLDRFKV